MARNGAGGYARITPGTPYVGGTTIDEAVVNAEMDDLGNEIANSLSKDGQTVPTANLPMGGYKHTGVANGSARNHYAAVGQVQDNAFNTGTVAGTADAITLTLSPGLAAYATGQRFEFIAGSANTGAATLNINSLGAKAIKRDVSVALQAGDIAASGAVIVEYDGTNFQLINPRTAVTQTAGDNTTKPASTAFVTAAVALVEGSLKKLAASATGGNATVTVTADEVQMESTTNTYATARAVSLSINSAASGANGLDTGSLAGSTWYAVWIIYNPTTATVAGLLSTSATAPTMPTDYVYKFRAGWIRTDGTANKYPLAFIQRGNVVRYIVTSGLNVTALPQIVGTGSGNVSTPTYTTCSVSSLVPTTAASITVVANSASTANGNSIIAPNANYGGIASTTNPPPLGGGYDGKAIGNIFLESTDIYCATDVNATVNCAGWIDNL